MVDLFLSAPRAPRQTGRGIIDPVERTWHDAMVLAFSSFDVHAFDDALEHVDRRLLPL